MASPLGFPPYSQQSSSGDRYDFNDLPPELALEHQALNRKQQIANMLIQQGLQPAQGQMVGGWYVPASPLQGAAGLAQILAGKYATSRNDEARRGLVGKNNDMLAQAMKGYKDSIADKTTTTELEGPGQPVRTAYPGEGFSPEELKQPTAMYGTTGEALSKLDESRPSAFFKEGSRPTSTTVTSRTPEEKRQAIIDHLAMSQIPQAQRMGQFMLGEMDRKEARGDQLAQRQSEMDQKKMEFGMIPASKQAEIDQKNRELGMVPAEKQAEIAAALQRHATPSGTAVMEDKTKRELYPVASGNALAAVDVQGQIALQAHQDRATQFEQNKRQDQAMLDMKKGQGLSDEAYRRDKLAMDAKHQQQQVALEAERNKISSMFHDAQTKQNAEAKTPPGYRQKDGNLEAIPGGPADLKQQGALNTDTAMLSSSTSAFDRLAEAAHSLQAHPGLNGITGLRGAIPNIPGSSAADAQAKLNNLKSQVGFGMLQELRNNSKSGSSGLGALSDTEGKRLESYIAALDNAQSYEQMKSGIKDIENFSIGGKDRLRDAFNLKHKQGGGLSTGPAASGKGPKVGSVEDGHRFKGGDPSKPESWEKVK